MQLPIQTDRLRLTEFAESDAESLFRLRSHPEVARFQGWVPECLREAEEYLGENLAVDLEAPGQWFQVAIRLRSGGALVGDIGLHARDPEHGQFEIGFTVDPEHQRRGYGQEAVRAALGALFEDLGAHRVVASVDPRNEASMALLPKLGFRKEAHHRRSLWFKGEWVDDVIFAMLAEEWRASRER